VTMITIHNRFFEGMVTEKPFFSKCVTWRRKISRKKHDRTRNPMQKMETLHLHWLQFVTISGYQEHAQASSTCGFGI